MSLQLIAKEMEAKGRKGDSMLVHMTPGEVAGLQKLAESAGGSLSVNPDTGLVEANFLKQMLPTLVGAGVGFFTANPMLGAAAGAAVGGYQANRAGQDVGAGMVMGGLGGYGGASLGSSLQAAGAPATLGTEAAKQAGTGAASKTATNMATNAVMQQALSGGQQAAPAPTPFLTPAQQDMAAGSYGFGGDAPRLTTAGTGAGAPTVQVPLNTSAPDNVSAGAPTKFADMTYSQRLDQGLGGIKAFGTEEGRDKALKALGGSEGVMRMLMMSGLPAMYGARTQVRHPYGLLSADINKRGFAEGGAVTQAVANRPFIIDPATGNVIRNPNLPPPAATTFTNMVGSDGGGEGIAPNPDFVTPSQKAAYYAERPKEAAVVNALQKGFGYTPFGMLQERIDPDLVDRERSVFTGAQSGGSRAPGYVGLPADMRGVNLGPPGAILAAAKAYAEDQRRLNEENAARVQANIGMTTVGGGIGAPSERVSPGSGYVGGTQINDAELAGIAGSPAPAANLVGMSIDGGESGPGVDGMDGDGNDGDAASKQSGEKLASGGLMGLARGGMRSGGFVIPADVVSMVGEGNTDAGYKRIKAMVPSATAIKGKDGGQSDTVKTSIEGKQRARVAHGEMYIPPETVKRLGGAKKLYAMMDRVRQQATGSKKQIKPVSLNRAMA